MSSYDIYRDSVGSSTALARHSSFEPVTFGDEPLRSPSSSALPQIEQHQNNTQNRLSTAPSNDMQALKQSRRLSSMTSVTAPTLMQQADAVREERRIAEEQLIRTKSIQSELVKDEEQMIAAPVLSKEDWLPGESKKEAHVKQRARRDGIEGKLNIARECCSRWSRRLWIGFAVLLVALAITLALCIPRIPTISVSQDNIFTSTDPSPFVASNPAGFHYNADFSFSIDAYSSFIPIHFSEFSVQVRDYETGLTIGHGNKTFTVPGRKSTDVKIPTYMQASFLDSGDTTYQNMRTACAHEWVGTHRPTLNVTLFVTSKVQGKFSTQTSGKMPALNLVCPVQWNATAG